MVKKLKVLSLVAAIAVVMSAASATSKADDIQIGGLVSFAPTTCAGSPMGCQSVTFSSLSVLATNPAEPVTGSTSPVSFPSFDLGWSGSAATFNPMSGALSISINGSAPLTGNIAFESLIATGAGGFQLDVALNSLTGGGSDPVLADFAASGQGGGILTFQFTSGVNSVASLVGSTTALTDNSVSATLTTPEPASLGLFGIGLLALAFAYRRRLKSLA